jgi:hypothetical protein
MIRKSGNGLLPGLNRRNACSPLRLTRPRLGLPIFAGVAMRAA